MGNREHMIFFPDVFNTSEAEAIWLCSDKRCSTETLRLEQRIKEIYLSQEKKKSQTDQLKHRNI